MANGEARVLRYLEHNGGVITRSEALALGMTSATLTRRLQTGHLVLLNKGLYALPGVLASERTALIAATSALGAVASHESAARLHGLEGVDPSVIAVTVPVRRSNRFGAVKVHQLTDLAPNETLMVDGVPTTDPPRTILDLATVCSARTLGPLVDGAVRLGLTSYLEISERLESRARKGKPGVTKLRGVLEPRLGGNMVSESTLETHLQRLITRAALPLPAAQFRPPWLKAVNGRVDLAYVDEQLIIEADSQRWHGSPEAFQADRQRDNLAQLAGWRILRFTWDDITKRPSYVVDCVQKALSGFSSAQI